MGAMSSAQEGKAAELLGQVQWVRAFTRSLVQDVHVAEDLAQETWVQALGQGRGEVRTPRAWMAGVARNLFRSSLRRERQRPQVEAEASTSEDVVSSQDLCARASQQRLLVGELLRLQEPYRTTLLLRFFEDLSQKEIARRMQVPVSTVGTRIARGLALMRAQLRARTGSRDDTAWVSALLPVLGRERSTVTSSSTLPWISPLAMAPPTKVALSLLVLAGSALLVGSLRSMDSPGHPRTEAAQVADPRAVRPTALVVGQPDPAPISVREELEEPRADSTGAFRIQGLEPRRYVLEAIDKVSLASVRQDVVAGDEDVLLSFSGEGMGPLAGRVVDLAGEPLAGVAVQLSHAVSGMGFTFGGRQVSDEDGAFRFERAAGDATLSLSGRTIVPELSRTVPEGDRERLEIVIGRRCHLQIEWGPWEGEDVEGYVVDAEGKPVVLALIQGNGWGPRPRVSSSAALSEVLAVSQAAKTLILEQEGSEVQRVPLELVPGEVTLVRP